MGNGCGIQIDWFSVQTKPYGSILYDFHEFGNFGIVFGGLTLLQEVPGPAKTALTVLGPCENVLPNW